MPHPILTPSPSRTYVAMCNKGRFDGFYFRKFTLPASEENTAEHAAWYFLNRLNFEACLEAIMTFEDYQNVTDQPVR